MNTADQLEYNIAGYQIIEQLYTGSRTLVDRAIRVCDQQPVILKTLRNKYPSFNELIQFRNQYTIAKNLNLPGIIQTYNLEPYGNGYVLVMEDFGGMSLAQFAEEKPLDITTFLAIAIQLAEILHGLYQHRVIHKDIKPANILIHPDTKQVKLIDFSISSLLPRETQEIQNPNILEGTLAYISPEQTGRMNRGIDYRTDFYSLGVTFYELLTGQLPFSSDDPMELVHCHLAMIAPPIYQNYSNIPLVLSQIVTKLIAKNAEDRYQSALGLKQDLQQCLTQWKETGKITAFKIAQQDRSDRFIIPEKLYGREEEVTQLLAAFERIAIPPQSPLQKGRSEMMLIAGFSGIGKTAVVNEVHKPIVRQRGYFIKGKFDQFNRNIPFSAFVQAFRDLMGQLLSESDAQLANWKTTILEAVGENGQVIVDVIPELEHIIGQQPPVTELSGSAAQNRFNLLLQKFIQVFTQKEHPLVIFLDDLQWSDSASLQLIKLLMADQGHLLLLGAYRDNEVSATHPFMLTVEELKKAGATVNTMTLQPLHQTHVNQLVADTLSCPPKVAQPLTELINQKTKGNPFFTTQFLKGLHQENCITFDPNRGFWQCDIAQVRALCVIDNVVEFMVTRLQKLPSESQTVLKLAACIGAQFDLSTLAIISEQSEADAASALWQALQAGLILPITETYKFFQINDAKTAQQDVSVLYKFLHDRVQQAAYSLIPQEHQQQTHLKIGRLLARQIKPVEIESNIFNLVSQFNAGLERVNLQTEKEEIARYNLIASQKAKNSAAYQPAWNYAKISLNLLGEQSWQNGYPLTLSVYENAVELAYLNGDFDRLEELAEIIFKNTNTFLDTIKTYQIKIQASVAQDQLLEGVKIGLNVLQSLGVNLPEEPTEADLQQARSEITLIIGEKAIADLVNLPPMTDPNILATVQILSSLFALTYFTNPNLCWLTVIQQVILSLKNGNAPVSAFAYANYGMMQCGFLQDIEMGYQFGQLALSVLSQLNVKSLEAKTVFIANVGIKHWKEKLQDTLPNLRDVYFKGLETGDLEFAGYGAATYCYYSYLPGKELQELSQEMKTYGLKVQEIQQLSSVNLLNIFRQAVLNLQQQSQTPWKLQGELYNEQEFLTTYLQNKVYLALSYLYFNKLILAYLFGNSAEAALICTEAEQYLPTLAGTPVLPPYYLYYSLTQLALYSEATETAREEILSNLATAQEKLKNWAHHAPMNCQHKYDLVSAEKCRVLGIYAEAIEGYDKAISGAKENEYIQEEALANELAAKFYLNWGKEKVAAGYLQEAYYCYAKWGAKAKIDDLEKRYPHLLKPILQTAAQSLNLIETFATIAAPRLSIHASTKTSHSSSTSINTALDFATIIKASQAISGTLKIDRLLHQLTQIILQNSGSDRCALILPNCEGSWQVKAIGSPENTELCSDPIEGNSNLPVKLIQYVKNTRELVMIDNLKTDLPVIDEYLMQQQPQSVLCLPILNQGHLIGILYLKNQSTRGIFTKERILILNFLCTQAAISLENAKLYQESIATQQQLIQQKQELERSQVQLSTNQSALRAILDNAPIWIWMTDIHGKMLFVNQTFCDDVGASEQDFTSASHYKEVIGEEAAQNCIKSDQACLVQDSPFYFMEILTLVDGKQHILETVKTQVKDKHNSTIGIIGLGIDVTESEQMKSEIKEKNNNLEKAMQELKNAQIQLVQGEKMSALGNLVAGVAHEINNPLGFITGNLNETQQSMQDVIEHLNLYRMSTPPTPEIEEHQEDIDLDYLLEDLPKMIDSMTLGCDRIKSISNSLRTFSRADQEYKTAFNLHDGLESTLLILKHRLKANDERSEIIINKNYGELPEVECFPGQLNQVFMNLLANAIDMFDEVAQPASGVDLKLETPIITIKTVTTLEKNAVEIRISDNGKGMSEEVKSRIFDHLFTTKSVGKGTGLGLAIARQIVLEKHGGSLEVYSTLNQGTEFVILLPISTQAL
jgi:PAS domain S-box-containing protein